MVGKKLLLRIITFVFAEANETCTSVFIIITIVRLFIRDSRCSIRTCQNRRGVIQGYHMNSWCHLTNTNIPIQDVYAAYHNLWHVERAFRIAKSKIEIRPMFHFTRKRIEAHICICFVALKVYKELERMPKVTEIKMSVDKVLALAKTITTIQIKIPLNKEVYTQTMLMARHQKIAKLFDEDFWVTR